MDLLDGALEPKDKALVRLFMAASFHRWELLAGCVHVLLVI